MSNVDYLRLIRRPFFSPEGAIGWELGPLDGLSCYLRCVESVLRAHGFEKREVANLLLQRLDLSRKDSTSSQFHGCSVEWSQGRTCVENWKIMEDLLKNGEPVILMPDIYYWPGHKFFGQRHLTDHMVLLTHLSDRNIHFLDTDGKAENQFQRSFELNESLIPAFCRFGRVRINQGAPFLSPEEVLDQMIRPDLALLVETVQEFKRFYEGWVKDPITETIGRSLHILCLGDFQPQLRMLSIALADSSVDQIRTLSRLAEHAARKSMQLGLALLSEHGAGRKNPYALSQTHFKSLIGQLSEFAELACQYFRFKNIEPVQPDGVSHFESRLKRLASYCYGAE